MKNKSNNQTSDFYNPYRDYERVESSDKYKHVSMYKSPDGKFAFKGSVLGSSVFHESELSAAKWVDIRLLRHGKEPVNKTLTKAR